MRRVLVTGGSGFVGQALVATLAERGSWQVRSAARLATPGAVPGVELVTVADLDQPAGWEAALEECDTVVHLAALAGARGVSEEHLRRINAAGTAALARRAAAAGVGHFILMSSAKAMGEATLPGLPFTPDSACRPEDAYGRSKLEAENLLRDACAGNAMAWTILRPPLVYGPGARNNSRQLMALVASGLPLPFAAVRNRRSLIAIDNLVDLVIACMEHPAARNHVFLASDGEDLSTGELLAHLRTVMGTRSPLLAVPATLLRAGFAAIGRREIGRRLLDSLQLDSSRTCSTLDWRPPVAVARALADTAAAFSSRSRDPAARRRVSR